MNLFSNWKQGDVDSHNARVAMKTAKQHNAALVGESDVTSIQTWKAAQHLTTRLPEKSKRIRQTEIKIRPWEQEWKNLLESSGDWVDVKAQSIRVRLANGAWFKGDISARAFGKDGPLHIFEIKGGKKMKGVSKGILALKVAAYQYPEIEWTLCWKENGEWKTQRILS